MTFKGAEALSDSLERALSTLRDFFSIGDGGRSHARDNIGHYREPQRPVRQLLLNRRSVNKDGLKLYYTNSRSFRNKIDLLRGKACIEKFDVISITETWVDIVNKKFMSELEIAGYQMFHRDRKRRKGGGLALYVRSTLKCTVNNSIRRGDDSETV